MRTADASADIMSLVDDVSIRITSAHSLPPWSIVKTARSAMGATLSGERRMHAERISKILDEIPAEAAWRRSNSIIIDHPNWFQVITPSCKLLPLNGIYRSILEHANTDGAIEKEIKEFGEHQTPFRWILTNAARPSNIGDRLAKYNFRLDHDALGLAVEASELLNTKFSDVKVAELTAEAVDEWVDAAVAGWGSSDSLREILRQDVLAALREQRQTLRYYSASVGSQIIGTGTLRLCGSCSYLLGSSVRPEFRGRGVYRALVATRAQTALHLGLGLMTAYAIADTSAPILERMGFAQYNRSTQFSHM
jgi:GNAT superfamily N-acetyltransferase